MNQLTEQQLADAMGISSEASALWLPHVHTALTLCKCSTPVTVAQWIAQIREESAGMTRLRESLDYSVDALLLKFGRHRISEEDARAFGRTPTRPANQRQIAMRIYGGEWGRKNLGNRIGTSDPWDRIGRGLPQVTGLANYIECGQVIGIDLERDPSALELRSTGAAATQWVWDKHDLTRYGGDVESVTRKINGGVNGLAKRQAWYDKALSVLAG